MMRRVTPTAMSRSRARTQVLVLAASCLLLLTLLPAVSAFTPRRHSRHVDKDGKTVTDCQTEEASTVWMCISTILVLGMSPALALFEAGMLRSKSTVSIISQIFAGVITLSVMWVMVGYSLTFGDSISGLIGHVHHAFYIGLSYTECSPHAPEIPAALFATFQMMFAVITPLLMTGAWAERLKFKCYMCLIISWQVLVYYPLAHWIWGGGWMSQWGVLDFAGGIVIHTSAGIGSLVCACYLGRRAQFFEFMGEFPPSNLPLAATGAALLWIGWFGFNGGSALQAGPVAVSAIVSTQIGCSMGAVTWLVLSWIKNKPQSTALINGALAGLAGITPMSGYIATTESILMGFIFGLASFYAVILMKHHLHIDDALDVSSVHGLTGLIGSLCVGLFAQKSIDPNGADGAFYGNPKQLLYQFVGVVVTLAYAGLMTFVLLKVIDKAFGGLRVNEDGEEVGLDWFEHHEIAYHKLHVLDDTTEAEQAPYPPAAHAAAALYGTSSSLGFDVANAPTMTVLEDTLSTNIGKGAILISSKPASPMLNGGGGGMMGGDVHEVLLSHEHGSGSFLGQAAISHTPPLSSSPLGGSGSVGRSLMSSSPVPPGSPRLTSSNSISRAISIARTNMPSTEQYRRHTPNEH